MFDGLILGKFSKKCKQAVRCIKLRMELIKKKKRVVVRILKKDVADLIAAGHESSGFGRMDSLIAEINLVSCYETIEKLCECILSQLPTLQKQRECPEESKEAISTLIYAAARFSDLPELRDLRSLFLERYGSCMESTVNAEFAEKTKRKSFSKEWKLKAMQDIADEFSISWRGAKKGEESCKLPSPESVNQTRSEQVSPPLNEEEVEEEIDKHQALMETKGIHVVAATKTRNSLDLQTMAPPETNTGRNHDRGGRTIEDKCEVLESIIEGQNIVSVKPLKPKPVNNAVTQPYGKQNGVHKTRGKIKNEEENNVIKPNMKVIGAFHAEKPKPFSVRRQFRQSPVTDTKDSSSGDKGRERRDTEATRDERDEEEKILDDLLLYYSRKGTTKAAKTATTMDDCERDIVKHQHGNGEGHQVPRIKVPPPKRTSSLPLESSSPAGPRAPVQVDTFQYDTVNHCPGRVHPRLPDYDQLAARFAALKNGLDTL
ncbi:uncharacterized protein LOC141824543 [Curcuma longa]|uniref:uncharacterized protein LOC141824543 n=1 Tax=Curcuma longa TaxID=136217 RepID=UPI003D9E40CE